MGVPIANLLLVFHSIANQSFNKKAKVWTPLSVWTPASLPYILFCNPAHKTEIGTTHRWELLIANHLDQSVQLTNQKWGATVRSYLLHSSLAGAEVCCAIYQPHQTQHIYRTKTIFPSQTGVCWLRFALPYVDFLLTSLCPTLMCRVTYQAPVGMLLWVQNTTRWKKKGQRADWEEKIAAVLSYWLQ